VEWLPVFGLVYDPKDYVVEIALEDVDHLIHRPREIYVEEDATVPKSLMIVDADGVRQIVKLRNPLMLPAAVSQDRVS
jgi:hypothetical protein